LEFHVGEQDNSVKAGRRTTILYIGDPSLITEVEMVVKLGQLVLKIPGCNINVDPEKIRFSAVVVDCS
jgi:hypothetical protein